MDLKTIATRAINAVGDPWWSDKIAPFVWLVDGVLCLLIVNKVPYTEIDWRAYMEQIYLILTGERDYAKVEGGTGPLVYPAGHVKIFSMLYDWTEGGEDIVAAQHIFMILYLLTLAIVLYIYVKARIPPGYLILAVLSKRLHSIYMLRMFNDCFTTLFAVSAIAILCTSSIPPLTRSTIATLLFSFAVSIKMSALLYLPGAAVVMLANLKSIWACAAALSIPFFAPQIILALPFIREYPYSYVNRAFEFSREFLYKWTVNWRFLDEEMFLSKEFAICLLLAHAIILIAFVSMPGKRFLQPFMPTSLVTFIKNAFSTGGLQTRTVQHYGRYVACTIGTSNLVGILCARSLHYQFYCWFYWSIPLLLATSSMPWYICICVWALEEYSWNVFPATDTSSIFAVLSLFLIVVNNYFVSNEQLPVEDEQKAK